MFRRLITKNPVSKTRDYCALLPQDHTGSSDSTTWVLEQNSDAVASALFLRSAQTKPLKLWRFCVSTLKPLSHDPPLLLKSNAVLSRAGRTARLNEEPVPASA